MRNHSKSVSKVKALEHDLAVLVAFEGETEVVLNDSCNRLHSKEKSSQAVLKTVATAQGAIWSIWQPFSGQGYDKSARAISLLLKYCNVIVLAL